MMPTATHPDYKKKQFHKFLAIWDTGATGTVISEKVVAEVGLFETGKQWVTGVNGKALQPTYMIDIGLPNRVIIQNVNVVAGKLRGFDILIGMNIICKGDFSLSNYDNQTVLTYSFPPHHNRIDLLERAETLNTNYKTPLDIPI
ncbi:clan AA aspartic protease [bacterium]|nr:clan AA aspartic protease [bacterium]